MKKLLIALLIVPTAVYAAQPFLIFASDAAYSDPATLPLVQRYLSAQDYLGYRAVTSTPQLRGIVSPAHQVEISASLAGLERTVQMGCGAQSPGVLYYQWGDASINPASELADPAGSIARPAAIVNSSGCHQMGLVPEGHFFSSQSCAADSTGGLYQNIDWGTIGFLDVTGNWLLTDACAGKGTVQDYVSFVRSIVAYVRQRNPRIVITAHLSFGNRWFRQFRSWAVWSTGF